MLRNKSELQASLREFSLTLSELLASSRELQCSALRCGNIAITPPQVAIHEKHSFSIHAYVVRNSRTRSVQFTALRILG